MYLKVILSRSSVIMWGVTESHWHAWACKHMRAHAHTHTHTHTHLSSPLRTYQASTSISTEEISSGRTQHRINWIRFKDTKILTKTMCYTEWPDKEAIKIQLHLSDINTWKWFKLSPVWIPTIKILKVTEDGD
jgi:hypothetical protein